MIIPTSFFESQLVTDRYLTPKEAADVSGISDATLLVYVIRDVLGHNIERVGNHNKYKERHVLEAKGYRLKLLGRINMHKWHKSMEISFRDARVVAGVPVNRLAGAFKAMKVRPCKGGGFPQQRVYYCQDVYRVLKALREGEV